MRGPEAMMSGPPIEDFAGGWADFPFFGERVHHWAPLSQAEVELYELTQTSNESPVGWFISKCGQVGWTTLATPALHEGNIPRCKNCQRRGAA